ncbi:hypothetical protein HDF08_003516 [Edaphobacter lichenicola]|uniref:Uncharacterized protein n=1 Tax=Tunturiibacter lichenicola TaxID=2051959 RepID=A0A852VLX3_9BACT|nr:hypothetical protein [Edaphobacter lichenicola]
MTRREQANCERWEPAEYAVGYGARLSGIPKLETSHRWWQMGRDDADTELLESARHP